MVELASILLCLWLAVKVRRRQSDDKSKPDPWVLARRSLRWGVLLVTLPLLGYFGALRYADGQGGPSAFSVIMCTGLTSLVMMGSPLEVTGNIIVDCILVSAGIVTCCFTMLNGLPVALASLNAVNLCRWCVACTVAAMLVRLFLWITEGN